jgi:hypothetical protein
MGIHIKRNHEILQKVAATLKVKKLSPFEFFGTLDVNFSGRISKIELKTGMQALGIQISTPEFNEMWKMIKKPVSKMAQDKLNEDLENEKSPKKKNKRVASAEKKVAQPVILSDLSYLELLNGFNIAGCFKYQ